MCSGREIRDWRGGNAKGITCRVSEEAARRYLGCGDGEGGAAGSGNRGKAVNGLGPQHQPPLRKSGVSPLLWVGETFSYFQAHRRDVFPGETLA